MREETSNLRMMQTHIIHDTNTRTWLNIIWLSIIYKDILRHYRQKLIKVSFPEIRDKNKIKINLKRLYLEKLFKYN